MKSTDTAKAFFKSYSDHNVEQMAALCAPDATFDYVPYGEQGKGTVAEQGVYTWKTLVDAFPDFKVVVERILVTEAGPLVLEVTLGGTQAKELFGIQNKGKYQVCPHLFILHFDDAGRISHIQAYWDNDTIYAQLGHTQVHQ